MLLSEHVCHSRDEQWSGLDDCMQWSHPEDDRWMAATPSLLSTDGGRMTVECASYGHDLSTPYRCSDAVGDAVVIGEALSP